MEWLLLDRRETPASRIDPYARWVFDVGRADFRLPGVDEQSVPLLIRWNKEKLRRFAPEARKFPRDLVEVWDALTGGPEAINRVLDAPDSYITHFLPLGLSVRLFTEENFRPFFDAIDRITFGPPLPSTSAPGELFPLEAADHPMSAAGHSVVVGIIDDGLPFGHERFRDGPHSTRVDYVWIQDGPFDGGASGFKYGRQITKSEIDTWLASEPDEDAFYRRAGVLNFAERGHKALARRATHGSHVMDLACGFDNHAMADWRIICVQLPVATTLDSSGASLAPYVVDAIKYIRNKAQAIAGAAKPIAVNFSYGISAGPHDGTHDIEVAVDEILGNHNAANGAAPMRVVIPSGNSYLGRLHAQVSFAGSQEETLTLRVLPNDLTPSFVEIWLPPAIAGANSRLEVSIVTPDGLVSPALAEHSSSIVRLVSKGQVLCELSYHFQAGTTERGMFLIALQPTDRLDRNGSEAPFGIWELKLKNHSLPSDAFVNVWIQRDDTPFGYTTRGRQSYFENSCYERLDVTGRIVEDDNPTCAIRRSGTLNALATGKRTIVIGGLLKKQLRPAPYSAGGPTTTPATAPFPNRSGPDALTVSDHSNAKPGVLAAGTRSGSVVPMNGTSVAAPRITRWVAEQLANGNKAGRYAVAKLATLNELNMPTDAPAKPSVERGGSGRILLPPAHSFEDDR